MKILQVVGTLDRGGAETWLVHALRHLDRSKYQIDFLVHADRDFDYKNEVLSLGARVIPCVPRLSEGKIVTYTRNFRRILRECGPYDIVHSHIQHTSGFVLALAAVSGVRVRIAHSHADTRITDRRAKLFGRMYAACMDTLIRKFATLGIACTDPSAAALFSESWSSDPRWKVLWYGIDLHPFALKVDSGKLRRDLGIPPNSFIVGHVGRFAEQKNHQVLVAIAERLVRIKPNAIFLLLGDGPLKPAIENLVEKKGLNKYFIFAGVRSDVSVLMKGAMDCFLMPSLFEGLPLVLLEAQAAGLSCVVSDTITEQASIVPGLVHRVSLQSTVQTWAEELRRLSNQRRGWIAEVPPQLSEYSIEASAAGLAKIYDSCLTNSPVFE